MPKYDRKPLDESGYILLFIILGIAVILATIQGETAHVLSMMIISGLVFGVMDNPKYVYEKSALFFGIAFVLIRFIIGDNMNVDLAVSVFTAYVVSLFAGSFIYVFLTSVVD